MGLVPRPQGGVELRRVDADEQAAHPHRHYHAAKLSPKYPAVLAGCIHNLGRCGSDCIVRKTELESSGHQVYSRRVPPGHTVTTQLKHPSRGKKAILLFRLHLSAQDIGTDTVGDPGTRGLDRLIRQMGVAGGCLHLCVTQ